MNTHKDNEYRLPPSMRMAEMRWLEVVYYPSGYKVYLYHRGPLGQLSSCIVGEKIQSGVDAMALATRYSLDHPEHVEVAGIPSVRKETE